MKFFKETALPRPIAITDELVARAEATLGLRLPQAYVVVLREQNGGYVARRCIRTAQPTEWGPHHLQVRQLVGLGHEYGIDGEFGSAYMITEWDYPNIGLVIFHTESGGHDTVMLDYSVCGPKGEPRVVYVGEDRVPVVVADSFAEFIARLEDCASFAAT